MKFNFKNYLITGALAVSALFSNLNNLYGQEYCEKVICQPKVKEEKIKETKNNKIKQKNLNFLEKIYLKKVCSKKVANNSNFSKLEKFANIRDENGKRSYTFKESALLWSLDNSSHRSDRYEYLKLINKKYNGKKIFNLDDIFMLSQFDYDTDGKRSPKNILKCIDYKDKTGNFIFSPGKIATYLQYGVNLRNLVEAIDSSKEKAPEEVAKEFYESAIKDKLKRNGLGELLNFNDTEKPNALITIPSSDWNRSFSALWDGGPGTIWHNQNFLLTELKKYYDIKLSVVETEQEVYSAIKETPNIEFLTLSGHGSKTTIALGDMDKRIFNSERNEKYYIDISDKEFKNYLNMLKDSATIFLYACSTAEKNSFNEENLAKFISESAKDKRVAAYKYPTSESSVKKYYPFEFADFAARFSGEKDPRIYYVNGKEEKQ